MKASAMVITAVALLMLPALGAEAQHVTIASTPPGATVFIDDTYAGTSPVSKDLAPGRHLVRLKRKGCRDWAAEITVPLDNPRIDVALKALKKGSIMVTSDPPGCNVYVNGRDEGITPLLIADLPDDLYNIRVQKPNYAEYQETVEVADGADVKLHAELQSRVEPLFRERLKEKPGHLPNYTNLGHYLLLEGKWDAAAEVFKQGALVAEKCKGQDRDVLRFYQELNKIYKWQFKFTERPNLPKFREQFRHVIEFAIEHGAMHHNFYKQLVAMYAATGNAEAIATLVERMHAADPARHVHREFGMLYLSRGMSNKAISMFTRAVEIKDSFASRYALGSAYQRRGQYAEALSEFERCEKMEASSPEQRNLMQSLARLYYRTGEHEKALKHIDQLLEHSKTGEHMMLKIYILMKARKLEEAKQLAEELAKTATMPKTRSDAQHVLTSIHGLIELNEAPEQ
ncbi:MAG: PEGA domain-containing protein [Planctomycetes bacterium]|nr:PEGA domain-containing protein [Planctomycetota bacterium]